MRPPAVLPALRFLRSGLCLWLGLGVIAGLPLSAQAMPTVGFAQEPPSLSYSIEARLEEDGHTITGQMEVLWQNQTTAPTDKILWHVYNNAWEGRQSSWMREARLQGDVREPAVWGQTKVDAVRLLALSDAQQQPLVLSPQDLSFEYLPQPGAPQDHTVAITHLPQVLAPGASVKIQLHFIARLPSAYRRSGWGAHGYLQAGQWFPKLGVFELLDGQVQWNCPPYRYLTEFYSEFANYKVALTLPARYQNHLVATGTLLSTGPQQNQDGSVTYFTTAEYVHDFAWTVDLEAAVLEREFRAEMYRDDVEEQRVARALGRTVEEVRPKPTQMILLLQPEHGELGERYFEALGKALYYFGLWYGSYPYPTITCVDPANDARWTSGMEYPRLIVGEGRLGIGNHTLVPEGVTVHEFGHQFWYGLVGTDEFRHAWMDEGFTTFSARRVLQKAFSPELDSYSVLGGEYLGRSLLSMPSYQEGDPRAFLRRERWESPDLGLLTALSLHLRRQDDLGRFLAELPPITYFPRVVHNIVLDEREEFSNLWGQPMEVLTMDLLDTDSMRTNAYNRPAMTLETMARMMGEERWTRLLRAYQERFRFRHPRPEDFLRILQELGAGSALDGKNGSVAIDWARFWRQAFEGNAAVDFAAQKLQNIPDSSADDLSAAPRFEVQISISRLTDFQVPVEVRVTWEDGSATDLVWAGDAWTWQYRWENHPLQAIKVEVDPRRLLLLDRDWLNNTRTREPQQDRAWQMGVRAMLWTQQVLHFFGGVG